MSPEELNYYRERARVERQCAADSSNRNAVQIHLKLAALYEQLVQIEEAAGPESQFFRFERQDPGSESSNPQ